MTKSLLYIFLIVLLSACAPSEQDIQTAVAQTKEAMPTETPMPFSDLRLDDLIVQPNDLPSGVSGSQINYYEDCNAGAGDKCAEYYISQDLAFENQTRGQVQIWVYEEHSYTSARYYAEEDTLKAECQKTEGQCYPEDPKSIPNLGEQAMMIDVYNYAGADIYYIVFTRCNAVVYVKIGQVANDPDGVVTYARRLDERLSSMVCR